MTKKLFIVLVAGVLVVFAIAPSVAIAVCKVEAVDKILDKNGAGDPAVAPSPTAGPLAITAAPVGGDTVNNEGITERVADILVFDDGVAPNCFGVTTQVITFIYGAKLTVPASITSATGSNFEVYDNLGSSGLTIGASSSTAFGSGNMLETVIQVFVARAGTAGNITITNNGSAFRMANLRFDVTPLAAGANLSATVSATTPGTLAPITVNVATIQKTIAPGSASISAGSGLQNSNGPLTNQATFTFAENFGNAFRLAGTADAPTSGVFGDIATNATSLIFNIENIPAGVTVTFPDEIDTVPEQTFLGTPEAGITYTLRAGSASTATGGSLEVIYDTTANNTGNAVVTVDTAATASDGSAVAPPAGNPKVGVIIGPVTGFGAASLIVAFGPTPVGDLPVGDDASANAVPRYTANAGDAGLTRRIVSSWFSVGPPQPPAPGLVFVPVTPCRVADTRDAMGPFGGPAIAAGTSRDFIIPNSACNIPSGTAAYSLNVAVVPQGSLGYLTVWPTQQPLPLVAALNSVDGRVKSNAAIVPAGAGDAISVFASNTTDVILDINGYFALPAMNPNGLAFYALTPCRVADTRSSSGPLGGPSLSSGQRRTFPLPTSACNLPSTAQAYSLNLTAVPKGPLGYLTAWPTGQTQPLVATLNAVTGAVTANAAIVLAGTDGAIDVFASNDTDLVMDINGYFAPPGPGGLLLRNLTPCRVRDTREPAGAQPFSGELDVNMAVSACGVPSAGRAFVLNATVVPPAGLGYLTMWPQGTVQPLVATLNAVDGAVTSNLAIVPTNNGSISVFASNPTHLVVDIFGYFAP